MSKSLFFDYYPLFLIIIGTALNLLTLITLYQSRFRDSKKQSIIHYIRAIAVFDILQPARKVFNLHRVLRSLSSGCRGRPWAASSHSSGHEASNL